MFVLEIGGVQDLSPYGRETDEGGPAGHQTIFIEKMVETKLKRKNESSSSFGTIERSKSAQSSSSIFFSQ